MNDLSAHSLTGAPVARTFSDGSEYRVVELATVRLGLGQFRPGWVWSRHAGAQTGRESSAHVGYIQSGAMVVEDAEGRRVELGPGDAFEVGPGHDAWVVGEKACIALDFARRPVRSARSDPLRTIKLAHTVIWGFFVGCILAIPLLTLLSRFALAAVFAAIVGLEVAVLLLNGMRCPLTDLAARHTADRRPNFDIYLPEWLARNNQRIFGPLYLAAVLFLLARWLLAS